MFAVGHIALGYVTGKILSKATDQSLNIPVVWTLSLLPDIDFLIPGLQHRGLTHSIIVAILIFVPFLLIRPRKTAPYFAALATHALIGDYITDGGTMLFWPVSSEWIKYERTIMLGSAFETYIELALFAVFIVILILSNDLTRLVISERNNNLLFIPLCAVVLPSMFKYPVNVPNALIIPHLLLLSMIALSLSISLIQTLITFNKRSLNAQTSTIGDETFYTNTKVSGIDREDLMDRLEQLEQQKIELQTELRKLKRKPEGKIGYFLLLLGLTLMALAVVYSHNVSAFIGIALTFWGALLTYIKPTQFIRKEILDSTVVEPLKYIHQLLDGLEFKGTPTYISPGTLRGLRSATIYIPKSNRSPMPSDEQLSQEEPLIQNPQAIKLTPLGLGLSRLLEDELKTNFSTVDMEYLQHNLEQALVEGLEITEAFAMEFTESTVQVEMKGTIFDEIVEALDELDTHRRIGDPLTSALACILARSTRHPIIIEKVEREPKKKSIQITFKIEGSPDEKEDGSC